MICRRHSGCSSIALRRKLVRDALQAKGIQPCIPGWKSRNDPVRYDKRRCRRRSRIEIVFGRLKDWHRAATPYDRCPTTFFSAIALAATVIFWL
ncbi:transposase [Sphingomonas desiccabilis]|nr:transposase [Sphingomonas desiccabilis]